MRIVTQPGWEDLRISAIVTVGLLGPLWIILIGAYELSLGVIWVVLCHSGWLGLGIAPVIATVLWLMTIVFFMKFLIRSMVTLGRADSQSPEIKDPAFSLAGALLPTVTAGVLRVGESTIALCLSP